MRKTLAILLAVLQFVFLCLLSAKGKYDEKREQRELAAAIENGVEVRLLPEGVTIAYTDDGEWLMTAMNVRGWDYSFSAREPERLLRLREDPYVSQDGTALYEIERPEDEKTTPLSLSAESYIDAAEGDYLLDRDAATALFGADLDRRTPYGDPLYDWIYDEGPGNVMGHWYGYDGKNEITVGGETYPFSIQAVVYRQRLYLTALVVGDRTLTLTRQHFEDDG